MSYYGDDRLIVDNPGQPTPRLALGDQLDEGDDGGHVVLGGVQHAVQPRRPPDSPVRRFEQPGGSGRRVYPKYIQEYRGKYHY